MTLPPSHESGNVVDPRVLAARRARRAEVSEDAGLELRLFEAERRLGEVVVERDRLRARVLEVERELTRTRQREWAEQQERLEAQGDAAAVREDAASRLAELREALAEAEAELATVAAERDRARQAVEDERLRVAAERERREALEREGLLLRSELARRDELTAAASQAVGAAREALASRDGDLEARVAAERSELAGRVEAVERAVASVRDRLGAAARVLKERLEAERRARVAAEAALGVERTARVAAESAAEGARTRARELERELAADRDRAARLDTALTAARARADELERAASDAAARTRELERELERRAAVEAQLRAAVDGLNAELDAARADDERMARLTERVERVVSLATRLQGDATAEQQTLRDLHEQLEAERAARWVAEAELDAERRRGDTDRAARAAAEAELSSLRTTGPAADPATLASLRDALSHLTAATPAAPTNPALDLDLAAAAARLRAAAEVAEAPEAEGEAEPEAPVVAEAPAPEPRVAVELFVAAEPEAEGEAEPEAPVVAEAPAPEPPVAEASSVAELAVAAEPSVAGPEPAAPEPVAPAPVTAPAPVAPPALAGEPGAVSVLAAPPRRVPPRAPIAKPAPWLRDALLRLAVDEPDIAELLLVALLPAQAGTVRRPITYDLHVDGGTAHRVTVEPDVARVALPRGEAPAARISGPLTALVPLAAGGARRRLPGATITQRRPLRKLLRARRAPVGLAELAAKGIAPSPGLLLTVLAKAVDPRWTVGHRLSVDIAASGADRWRVSASGDGTLTILPAEGAPPADATLHTAAALLPAVLAGTASPEQASVEGSLSELQTLLSWLDRAQRGGR
ncbi:MAG TPA: hypothetical protein VFG42_04055 [Baekduia sp.]|uniref:hypothetical protein n=1 Tax=Baekduia sp. TaxID=2600305 RepID=UPI002D7A34A4|nr:hypothetical protein [Baekduia sp.]HET6505938.1 hypothetical protein [Baekduia sp.]